MWLTQLHVAGNDASTVEKLLADGTPDDGLQHAGQAVIRCSSSTGLIATATTVIEALSRMDWSGDPELIAELEHVRSGTDPELSLLPVDLDGAAKRSINHRRVSRISTSRTGRCGRANCSILGNCTHSRLDNPRPIHPPPAGTPIKLHPGQRSTNRAIRALEADKLVEHDIAADLILGMNPSINLTRGELLHELSSSACEREQGAARRVPQAVHPVCGCDLPHRVPRLA